MRYNGIYMLVKTDGLPRVAKQTRCYTLSQGQPHDAPYITTVLTPTLPLTD